MPCHFSLKEKWSCGSFGDAQINYKLFLAFPREAAQGRSHHGIDLELQNQRAFATNVHGLLGCVAGHNLHGIYPTGFMSCGCMSCAMPIPRRGFCNVGNYNDTNVVEDKASKHTAAFHCRVVGSTFLQEYASK